MVRQEKSILFWIIPFLAVFLAVPLHLLAQGGATGAISGTVRDQSGAVLARANVAIISEATGQIVRQLKADASGVFSAPLLPVGTYTLEVNAAGFAPSKFTGVEVRITETTSVTALLQVAAVREVVQVQSQVATVDTSDATMGQAIGSTTVASLPLATRNFQQLLDLSAGAAADLNNAAGLGRGSVAIDVNGARQDNNNYLIEGISASDYVLGSFQFTPVPNPDSIQEFKVSTSLYDASQGRNGGGNMDAVLKTGTSSFHGDMWEYFRNSKLDAADYFVGPFVLKQNIFGGDFGGPVAPKGKLGYFYVNYQGTRQRSGDSLGTYLSNVALPVLPANRTSQNLVSAFFPDGLPSYVNTANGYGGLDPVAYKLLTDTGSLYGASPGGYLIPTVPGTAGNLNGSLTMTTPGSYREDQFTANWDRDFNHAKDHLAERFFWSDAQTYEPFGGDGLQLYAGGPPLSSNLDFPVNIPLRGRFGSIEETHTFTDALINEFRFGVNVIGDSVQNISVAGTSSADLGIVNGTGSSIMYRFALANGLSIGPYPMSYRSLGDTSSWLDTVSWTHGQQMFRFGGEIDRNTDRGDFGAFFNGFDTFTPGEDSSLNYFQNFLLGEPNYSMVGGGVDAHDFITPSFAVFAQDDYRVASSLTLNLGLRTEWVGASYDDNCAAVNVSVAKLATTGNPFEYPACVSKYKIPGLTGTNLVNKGGFSNEYATVLEPRIGFAWNVGGKQKTVIHGGYGYYSIREDAQGLEQLITAPPFFVEAAVTSVAPGTMGTMFSGVTPLGTLNPANMPSPSFFQGFVNCGTGTFTTDTTQCASFSGGASSAFNYAMLTLFSHWIEPTTQQWNLSVERQLGANWVLNLGYVGTKGTHLRLMYDQNQPALASPSNPVTATCGNAAAGVPCLQPGVATGGQVTITENTMSNAAARAPYLGANPSDFQTIFPISDSHYHALQATVSHHFGRGLYFLGAYTWSKSIDNDSTGTTASLERFDNQLSSTGMKGLSDFNRASRLSASFNYDLPSLPGGGSLVKYALGNWGTSGVIIVQSGTPITIMDGNGGSDYLLATVTPDSTASFASGYNCSNALNTGNLQSKVANWVNPAAYQGAPVVGSDGSTGWGDSPRNCIVGPGQWNVDFTLHKKFSLMEHQNLLFTTEFFNLFNHPSFENPVATGFNNVALGSEVGKITQTVGTPRLVQFSLKYTF